MSAEVAQPQGEPPLEEDQAHREGDHGDEELAEDAPRVDHVKAGARHEADGEKEQDRREPQPPGHPLGEDPDDDQEDEALDQGFVQRCLLSPRLSVHSVRLELTPDPGGASS